MILAIILTRDSEPSELLSMVKKIRLKNVHIKSDSPDVTIELTRLWARLYVGSSEDKSAGIFYNLDQILSSQNRSLKWLYNYLFLWILSGIFVLANIPIFLLKIDLRLITLITSVYFMWGFWVVFTRLNRHLTIILKRNKEQGSFIQRKKDELAVAIVAAILGALIGFAGTVLVTTYLKK